MPHVDVALNCVRLTDEVHPAFQQIAKGKFSQTMFLPQDSLGEPPTARPGFVHN